MLCTPLPVCMVRGRLYLWLRSYWQVYRRIARISVSWTYYILKLAYFLLRTTIYLIND
jgi:hypothetical protein